MIRRFCLFALIFVTGGSALANTNLIQQIDANTLQIGAVRLNKKERELSIPASVNMVDGPVEYVLVSAMGKLHESIFKTTAEPIHIHTAAMLLLPEPISSNRPPSVRISVELPKERVVPIEETFKNTILARSLKTAPWKYRGSRLVEGTFIAQRDGSVVSIISDPDAMAETGRVTAEDDENWRPDEKTLPPVGTPVKIRIKFAEAN